MKRATVFGFALQLLLLFPTAHADDLVIRNATGIELVTFFATGDVHIAVGGIFEGANATLSDAPDDSAFFVKTSAGNVILCIEEDTGDLNLAGRIEQRLSTLAPPPNAFTVRGKHEQVVSYIDSAGNLVTKGRIFLHGRPVQRDKGGDGWGGHSSDISISSFEAKPRVFLTDPNLRVSATIVHKFELANAPITPIAEIQSFIDLFTAGISARGSVDAEDYEKRMAQLSTLANGDRRVMFEQLFLYHGLKRLTNSGMASEVATGLIVDLKYEDSEIVSILLPILQNADAYWSERIARVYLNRIGDTKDYDQPDYILFQQFIQEKKDSPEQDLNGVYRFLFKRSPSQTVRMMQNVYGVVPGLHLDLSTLEKRFGSGFRQDQDFGEISDSEVNRILHSLSTHSTWWVRAFAAQVLIRQSASANLELVSRLEADPHPLVAEFGKEIARTMKRKLVQEELY